MIDEFLKVPDEEGMRRANRHITLAGVVTLLLFGLFSAAAWHLTLLLLEVPTEPAGELAFALKGGYFSSLATDKARGGELLA